MAAPKLSTVTKISFQTHPILVTVDAFQPGLCHEGIENATVTRIAFLSGPLPVAVDPTKEHDDDDDDDVDDVDDDDDDHDDGYEDDDRMTMMMMMMMTIRNTQARTTPGPRD